MDPKKFKLILEQYCVRENKKTCGVSCALAEKQCMDCQEMVRGRRVYYIKKWGYKREYWAKKCVSCSSTVGHTDNFTREFIEIMPLKINNCE